MRNVLKVLIGVNFVFISLPVNSADLKLDERPAAPGEWGYRPADGSVSPTNPPSFCWRPQAGISCWDLRCEKIDDEDEFEYSRRDIRMNVACPSSPLLLGKYSWCYRGVAANGDVTNWSQPRTVTISPTAVDFPMPTRDDLLSRIPASHPRLFVRPENLPRLRELAQGPLREKYEQLIQQCERLVRNPPDTAEPPKYPPDCERKSEQWREIWWGNRTYTIRALNGAATLAFTRLLGGDEKYGQLARRILLDCARWDPKGATGYRYNDEAGMPYAYYFARTYTFVNNLLTEEEREICRRVMKIRGDEMYRHLHPRHLWQPYSSHSNRAWHFLGEVGIAMHGEVEGADDWAWFAANVFFNVYPVWSDDDGGWHEGHAYWNSYISRFTWWADIMRTTWRINAYEKPYFSKIGYYPIYLAPPHKVGAGFGDLNGSRRASHALSLMSQLAAQAGNRHWQWYVDQMGGRRDETAYVGFIRGTLPKVEAKAPADLPSSRAFRGTGLAFLNTSLDDAREDVQVAFKSSPFGTWSHGYDANNSFLLWAYGQRLLIRTGRRDIYASDHHRRWMWSTRSVNSITIDGQGQVPHSAASQGRIVDFVTTSTLDAVVGEAGDAYVLPGAAKGSAAKPLLDRFTRSILFVKPDLVIVYDRLVAKNPSTFEYWLHSSERFEVDTQYEVDARVGDVCCDIAFLAPKGLHISQTNEYDPNPRPRVKLREWHLTAKTPSKEKAIEFVTLMRPYRASDKVPFDAHLGRSDRGYILNAKVSDGAVTALLPADFPLTAAGLSPEKYIVCERRDLADKRIEKIRVRQE